MVYQVLRALVRPLQSYGTSLDRISPNTQRRYKRGKSWLHERGRKTSLPAVWYPRLPQRYLLPQRWIAHWKVHKAL